MRRENTNHRLTVAEVNRRLRAIKRSLNNKSQVLYYFDRETRLFDNLSIDLTNLESFYVNPISFDKRQFLEYVRDNRKLFDVDNFIHQDTLEYTSKNKKTLCKNFAITAMLFTKFRDASIVQKHVIVCTGSIYHAPRLFYKDKLSGRIVYEKCSEYLDLL